MMQSLDLLENIESFCTPFAGRRRRGDLQFYLDRMQPPSNYVLHVVSVDIVIDSTWGDVTADRTRTYWLLKAQEGLIVGFLAGPPCETWSRAQRQGSQGAKTQIAKPPESSVRKTISGDYPV